LITTIVLFILIAGILPLAVYIFRQLQKGTLAEDKNAPLDANLAKKGALSASKAWWEQQRGRFNRHLFLAGIFAVCLYYAQIYAELGTYQYYEFHFSWWHTLFVGILYLVYMGIANLLYNIGILIDQNASGTKSDEFRQKTYRWIALIATLFPFLFVLLSAFA
jgi:hypothetical protein